MLPGDLVLVLFYHSLRVISLDMIFWEVIFVPKEKTRLTMSVRPTCKNIEV